MEEEQYTSWFLSLIMQYPDACGPSGAVANPPVCKKHSFSRYISLYSNSIKQKYMNSAAQTDALKTKFTMKDLISTICLVGGLSQESR